jgi:predicted transglutaminase-like cysteine proteinase
MFSRHLFLLLSVLVFAHADSFLPPNLVVEAEKRYGTFAKNRFVDLQNTMDEIKNKNVMIKLNSVNTYFNQIKYKSDLENYHVDDYWATPWEFVGRNGGDCEDYVIAKYFALRYLGISSKQMYFTYVRSSLFKEAHMVLTYFDTPTSEPLVLDNNNRLVLPASKRTDLTPIYNFNGELLSSTEKKNNQKMMQKWDELILNTKKGKI